MSRLLENTSLIINYYAGDLELARNSLLEFVDTIDEDIDQLMEYYDPQKYDTKEVFLILHKLKPSFFYMDMEGLYNETCQFIDLIRKKPNAEGEHEKYKIYMNKLLEQIRNLKSYADEVMIKSNGHQYG